MTLANLFRSTDKINSSHMNSNPYEFARNDLSSIVKFFYVIAALSIAAVVWYCGLSRAAAAPLLWGLACASLGAAFGFLFGIPKILQGEKPISELKETRSVDYRQQVNTNLTEISDWLTKIIVGLGLINLSKIPPKLTSAAQILAVNLNPAEPGKEQAFALALILCFLILGFLFGYLSTRLFLQAAFSRADQEAAVLRRTETAIATTEARISTLETKQEYILSAEPAQPNGLAETEGNSGVQNPMVVLKTLANHYLLIVADTLGERKQLKNRAASEMLNYIRSHRIPKDLVFREAEQTGNEGMILALANYIVNYPDQGDFDYIGPVADRVSRLHVKYRVVQAIGELFAKTYATAADSLSAERIFSNYEKSADQHLLSLIKNVRVLVSNMVKQEESLPK